MSRWHVLATYNAERARGIVHTPEWKERMAAEQAAFDAEMSRCGGVPDRAEPPRRRRWLLP